jgi:hypothetical protein
MPRQADVKVAADSTTLLPELLGRAPHHSRAAASDKAQSSSACPEPPWRNRAAGHHACIAAAAAVMRELELEGAGKVVLVDKQPQQGQQQQQRVWRLGLYSWSTQRRLQASLGKGWLSLGVPCAPVAWNAAQGLLSRSLDSGVLASAGTFPALGRGQGCVWQELGSLSGRCMPASTCPTTPLGLPTTRACVRACRMGTGGFSGTWRLRLGTRSCWRSCPGACGWRACPPWQSVWSGGRQAQVRGNCSKASAAEAGGETIAPSLPTAKQRASHGSVVAALPALAQPEIRWSAPARLSK